MKQVNLNLSFFYNYKISLLHILIFQYDFKNLEYLNLENNEITNGGLKALQNKSLINIKYLNLSNNPIRNNGLTYLNYLSNLNELILLNMYKLLTIIFLSCNQIVLSIK